MFTNLNPSLDYTCAMLRTYSTLVLSVYTVIDFSEAAVLRSRSRLEPIFCWQAKKEGLAVVTKHDLRAIFNGKCDPKKTCINNSLFKSSK